MPLGKNVGDNIKELYKDNQKTGKARGANGKVRSRAQIIAIAESAAGNSKKKVQVRNTKKVIISPYHNQLKKMKLIELIGSIESLNKLSETKLPAGVGFSLGKFLKQVTPEIETYNKVRSEKVLEYGKVMLDAEGKEVTDENGNKKYSFSDEGSKELNENGKKFVEEITELENKELDVKIPEIKIADLSNVVIEPKYLVALSWLIKED